MGSCGLVIGEYNKASIALLFLMQLLLCCLLLLAKETKRNSCGKNFILILRSELLGHTSFCYNINK